MSKFVRKYYKLRSHGPPHTSLDRRLFCFCTCLMPNRSGKERKTAPEDGRDPTPRQVLRRNCQMQPSKKGTWVKQTLLPPYCRGRCLRNQELYILTVDRQKMIPTHSISTIVHRMMVKHPAKWRTALEISEQKILKYLFKPITIFIGLKNGFNHFSHLHPAH